MFRCKYGSGDYAQELPGMAALSWAVEVCLAMVGVETKLRQKLHLAAAEMQLQQTAASSALVQQHQSM